MFHHLLAALPSIAPILTLGSVVLVVILERDLGINGAILGKYNSSMSVLFNFSVLMIIGAIVWAPAGLILSTVISKRLPGSAHRKIYPIMFASLCILCILFAVVDPDGMMTYYLD